MLSAISNVRSVSVYVLLVVFATLFLSGAARMRPVKRSTESWTASPQLARYLELVQSKQGRAENCALIESVHNAAELRLDDSDLMLLKMICMFDADDQLSMTDLNLDPEETR